jgi:hypothetical protein
LIAWCIPYVHDPIDQLCSVIKQKTYHQELLVEYLTGKVLSSLISALLPPTVGVTYGDMHTFLDDGTVGQFGQLTRQSLTYYVPLDKSALIYTKVDEDLPS